MRKKKKNQPWPPCKTVRVAYSKACGAVLQFRPGAIASVSDCMTGIRLLPETIAFIASNKIPITDGDCFY